MKLEHEEEEADDDGQINDGEIWTHDYLVIKALILC
jgi:hypothetical protein